MGPDLVLQKSLTCDGPIGLYRAVVQTGNESGKQADSAGAFTVGFNQEEIDAEDQERGRHCTVRVLGISRAIAGAALEAGQAVQVDGEGRVVPATGGYVVGRCVTPVTQANDWTAVFLTHEGGGA